MTVQAGVEISLELLVGEMPTIPCEHSQHHVGGTAHGGEATHYSQRNCTFCGDISEIQAVCLPFATHVLTDGLLRCMACEKDGNAHLIRKILGLVKP